MVAVRGCALVCFLFGGESKGVQELVCKVPVRNALFCAPCQPPVGRSCKAESSFFSPTETAEAWISLKKDTKLSAGVLVLHLLCLACLSFPCLPFTCVRVCVLEDATMALLRLAFLNHGPLF